MRGLGGWQFEVDLGNQAWVISCTNVVLNIRDVFVVTS